ncbi:MAG: leucine-rich repeat domain-containing protein [Candidatus Kariarchaeaceae archaeon]|jgi:Leucine-rich repeat (LRR) protein
MTVEGMRDLADDLGLSYMDLIQTRTKLYGRRKFLNLSNLELKELPRSLLGVSHIASLDLSNNHFDEIPEMLYEIKPRSLLLLGNEITRVDSSVQQLEGIVQLNLRHNGIGSVSPELLSLKSLNILDLGYNAISTLPDPDITSSNLSTLTLSHNRLQGVDALGELNQLHGLYLDHNRISEIPELAIPYLGMLNLAANSLTSFAGFETYTSLLLAHLEFNPSQFTENVALPLHLKRLSLSIDTASSMTAGLIEHVRRLDMVTFHITDRSSTEPVASKVEALLRLVGVSRGIYANEEEGLVILRP